MDENSGQSMRAAQAFAGAGAEICIETLKSRRWIFLVAAVVIGMLFPAIGILYASYQPGLESILFGAAFILIGIVGGIASLNNYRRMCRFVDLYEQKLTRGD